MFSGGSYEEVARWLRNFLASHAKREDPRVEVILHAGDDREGKSYGLQLRLGEARSALRELPYAEVAENRGTLAWCREQAEQIRALARDLLATSTAPAGRL